MNFMSQLDYANRSCQENFFNPPRLRQVQMNPSATNAFETRKIKKKSKKTTKSTTIPYTQTPSKALLFIDYRNTSIKRHLA